MWRAQFFAAVTLVGFATTAPHATAQVPAPGSGHGFLIDKHVAAGIPCSSCHTETPPSKAPDNSACGKCHGSYADLAAKTQAADPNPHASHLGAVPCSSCHHVHQASVTYCTQCHSFDMKTP